MYLFVLSADTERQRNAVSACPMGMNFLLLKTEDIVLFEATVKAILFDVVILDAKTTMDFDRIRSIKEQTGFLVIIATQGTSNGTHPWTGLADAYLTFSVHLRELEGWCERLVQYAAQRKEAVPENGTR